MKIAHFLIAADGSDIEKNFPNAFVAFVDGQKTATIREFYDEIPNAMHFEDEPVKNLEVFDAILNDLQWIDQEQVIIYISNSADWLSKEKSEEKILAIIDVLDATAEDWKWVEDDDDVVKKDLKIVFQDSQRIKSLLESQEIPFAMVG